MSLWESGRRLANASLYAWLCAMVDRDPRGRCLCSRLGKVTFVAPQSSTPAFPPIVSREEWQTARDALLVKEKAHTRAKDALSAERRRLPMVRIDKDYRFTSSHRSDVGLIDLFEGRRQLVIYHFMFHPDWEKGCPNCTFATDQLGNLDLLAEKDVTFALVSRAPIEKLRAYRAERGWAWPWYSSFGTSFNRDFGATVGDDQEIHAYSAFVRDDAGTVYQTYATGGRGAESMFPAVGLLDMTVYGRQEDFEDSPAGWPQEPTYG